MVMFKSLVSGSDQANPYGDNSVGIHILKAIQENPALFQKKTQMSLEKSTAQ